MATGWLSRAAMTGLIGGEVSDERAQRGGGVTGRRIDADAVRQRRVGQDAQENQSGSPWTDWG